MIIPTRNRIKQIYPNIKEGKVYHNSINTPSLINISIRNKKIAESLSPSRKMMNKTTSESFFKNKKGVKKQKYFKKIKKNDNFKNKKNYCNSSIELNNRKRNQTLYQKNQYNNYSKEASGNKYKNTSIENIKLSKNIFNNLDKIHETLLADFKNTNLENKHKIEQNKKHQDNIISINNCHNNNIKIEKQNANEANNISNNKNKDNDFRYHTVTIKSRTAYNFYPNCHSPKKIHESSNLNTTPHKRTKTHEEKKPHQITRYLERRKINDLPVTFPLYLSHNNQYNSMSEKNRVDKILSKLICLKTHLIRDPLNRMEIIKEFFLKNGFDKDIYFEDEKIINFYNYLKQPFSFPPEYNLSKVINEGINYKCEKNQEDNNDIHMVSILDYVPNRKWKDFYKNNNNKIYKNTNGNQMIYNVLMEELFKKRYMNYENFRNKALPTLIKDLEYELRQIKIDKMNKLDIYNNLIDTRKVQTIKLIDKNKYVPNLCLISNGFKEKYKAVIDKKNRKIIKNMNRQEHLKQINNRLYYDNIRKNNLIEFDRNDIQKKLKLTEFVVMERAKKILLLQKAKNTFMKVLNESTKKH